MNTPVISAYRRIIDGCNGLSNPVEVELHRAYVNEPIRVAISYGNDGTTHLDLDRARQLREALDEAIMLAELAS